MPILIAEDVSVYKIPTSKGFGTAKTTFIQQPRTFGGYVLGYAIGENAEVMKVFDGLSEGSVLLDRLYSIGDLKINSSDIKRTEQNLPESYEVTLPEQDFLKEYKDARDRFERSPMKASDLVFLQDELKALRMRRKPYAMDRKGMLYVLQLTGDGWIFYSDPGFVDGGWPGVAFLGDLRDHGIIGLKTMNGKVPYYVRLTKEGVVIKEDLNRKMEENQRLRKE